MFKTSVITACGLAVLLSLPLAAQDLGNSPYSRFGLGDLAPDGTVRNSGMAGAGVASPNTLQINQLNPALLPYNNLVIFELAATSQIKRLQNRSTSQQDGNVGLRYLAFAFPVAKQWTTSIGLKPYSNVNYKIVTEEPVVNDPSMKARYLFQGSGGINEVYWGNGVKIGKKLSVGVQASYLFGHITNEVATQVLSSNNTPQGSIVALSDRKTLNDFAFKGGLAYRTPLSEHLHLGLGLTYQYMLDLKAKQLRTLATAGDAIDTLAATIRQEQQRLEVPHPLQAGVSIDNGRNWSLSADYHTQDWSDFTAFGEQQSSMGRSYRVALGGEYVPDPAAVKGYFKRVTYRGGLSYGRSPISIRGNQINEQLASFGLSLPTGRGGSVINLTFGAGSRGTTRNGLVRESYYRFELGLSLNDRWFQRQRID